MCLGWVDQRELEYTEVEFSLPCWTTGGARVLLDLCHRLERERTQRKERSESEPVPVDDNGKVVPLGSPERCVKQYGAIMRTNAEHAVGAARWRRIERRS